RHQRNHFRGRYCLIMLDILGHGAVALLRDGEDSWPQQEFSITQAAARVQQLLEQLAVGPGFLIGVSMSAAIALQIAVNAPRLVRGLVLVSPWSYVDEHIRELTHRLFRLAEAANMPAHMELLLRYLFPPAYAEAHVSEVEWVRGV